jgi:integrase
MAIKKLKDKPLKVKGKPLTDLQVSTLPAGPDGKAKYWADTGGLYLIVRRPNSRDSRSFAFKGTLNRRQLPMLYLGPYPKLSLLDARIERDRCNELLRAGKDPRTVKLAKKVQQDTGPPPTVIRLANRYFEKKIEPKREHETESNRRDRISAADRHISRIRDRIGKMAVADVGDVDREALLKKLGLEEMSPSARWDFRRHFKRMFGMAVALRWISPDKNPATDEVLNAFLTEEFHKRERRKSLNWVDAPRFVANIKAYKNRGMGMADRPLATVPALLFLVYTGVRTGEVTQAQWGEIDWDNRLWNVPASHRKAGHKKAKIRAIPISEPMLKLLNEQKRRTNRIGDDDLIFPGKSRVGGLGRGVLNSFIKNTLRPKWDVLIDPHGFRGTLHAWATAQRPPYPEVLIKAQFDHVGKTSSDDDDLRRSQPSVIDTHYSHGDRPEMTDPTLREPGGRRELTERYDAYLDSYEPPAPTAQ